MLVLTVQKYKVLQQVYSREGYSPKFWLSDYAFLSPNYSKGYKYILNALSRKTGKCYDYGDESCIWGWVQQPYLGFYQSNACRAFNDRFYAVICDIPESQMVFSDYDKFCSYVEGESVESFLLQSPSSVRSECIQCSFWNLSKESIKLVVDLDCLKEFKYDSIEVQDLYNLLRMRDESYMFENGLGFLNSILGEADKQKSLIRCAYA